nr:N-acetylmuramoyl-L-alanine amidase [[Clostridium] hylemonae]
MSRRSATKLIILHHAEASNCTVQDIHRWHKNNGWAGIGYHFLVRKDGSIYRGRPEWAVGAHASGSNSDSIGICFEGAYMTETMPAARQLRHRRQQSQQRKVTHGCLAYRRNVTLRDSFIRPLTGLPVLIHWPDARSLGGRAGAI